MAKKTRSRRKQRFPDADADANAMSITDDETGIDEQAAPSGLEETGGSGDVPGEVTAVSLPGHIVDGILWYLSAVESARLAAVCKSWSAIAARRLANPAPHLFAFRSTATHRRGEIISVPQSAAASRHGGARVSPAHRELRRVTRRTECLGATAGGRFVLANTRRTVLFNPVTGTFRRIKKFPGEPHHVISMPIVPLAGDSFFHAGWNEVGVWRAADDAWTVRHVGYAESLRLAALCTPSVVFALGTDGYVFRIELPSLYATKVAAPSLLDKDHTALPDAVEKGYLVAAAGEVHFVWPLFTTIRVRGKRDFDPELFASDDDDDDGEDDDYFFDDVTRLSGFDVYRLDMEGMRWVEVDRLAGDDTALFVSRWSSFSVRASEKGCVSNCVYFVCDEGAGSTWGAFSLGERSMLFEHAIGAGGSYKERLWFYPSLKEPGQEDLDRRLDEIGYI